MMTPQQVFDLLLPIPSEQWLVNSYTNHSNQCCAMGHLIRLRSSNPNNFDFESTVENDGIHEFYNSTIQFLKELGHSRSCIMCVNDGEVKEFNQPHPKYRVLAFLEAMVEADQVIA